MALCAFTAFFAGLGPAAAIIDSANATPVESTTGQKPAAKPKPAAAAKNSAQGAATAAAVAPAAPGPYYVDFRARTAASYGHAFIWFGKSTQREVEVAGLHPATDSPVPYVLGHMMPVPSETGASYGDLDEQYLTANYRVYLSEEDAPKVFAYIQKLQKNTPFWNATTTNCTWFIGQIASFMGLKTPWHLLVPEDYVNELKKMNGGREVATLSADK
nr:hypothetical protein [Ancylobacter moscoviensis]